MEKINSESKINEIKGLIQRKQYIVAEKKARELLKQIDPKNNYDQQNFVSVVLLLSESLTKNIKNILAIEELEKARKFFPEDERLLEEIFLLSLKMKRLPKAEEFLKEIVALNPAKLENRFRLISFYTDKDDYFNAGLEIRNLAVFGVDNVNINQMLLFCLKKNRIAK
jgi:tetratricopeptide (TPR) repeat protein